MVLLDFIGAVFIAFMLIFTHLEEGYWIRHIAEGFDLSEPLAVLTVQNIFFFLLSPVGILLSKVSTANFFFFK